MLFAFFRLSLASMEKNWNGVINAKKGIKFLFSMKIFDGIE